MLIKLLIITLFAYLLGSVCSAILVCKLFKLPDPRTQGSRNPGATNVKRIGGLKPAILTLLLDFLKGFVIIILARKLIPGISDVSLSVIYFAVIFGHCYSVFYGFQGGKGIATGLGGIFGLFGILNWVSWGSLGLWGILFLIFRISAVSGLGVFLIIPVLGFFKFGLLASTFMFLSSVIIFGDIEKI